MDTTITVRGSLKFLIAKTGVAIFAVLFLLVGCSANNEKTDSLSGDLVKRGFTDPVLVLDRTHGSPASHLAVFSTGLGACRVTIVWKNAVFWWKDVDDVDATRLRSEPELAECFEPSS